MNHEYVDFVKLLRKDKVNMDEDSPLVLVNKGGQTALMPYRDRSVTINSYNKWEQSFRIFSDVYTSHYPERAPELIQYNHIIHNASQTYYWDNVYTYDKEF